ncbi:MAG: hypothetical protein IIW20_00280 [Clostridia bacterium]|nr:hypothetical protein [Clostridia bacterium]
MYIRSSGYSDKSGDIPENYSGIALSKDENRENANNTLPKEEPSQNAMSFTNDDQKREDCKKGVGGGLISGLFDRLGIKEVESSDITLLALAVLLIFGEDDDYVWIFLLLLLIVK